MPIVVLVALATGCGFGVVDAHWATGSGTFWLSQMSSLWLLLPFLGGWASRGKSMLGAALGLGVTLAALAGYYGWLLHTRTGTTYGAHRYVDAALLGAPILGWLGSRWASMRLPVGPAALCCAFLLEPYAWRMHEGFLPAPTYQWRIEQLTGLLIAVGAVAAIAAHRRRTSD